MIDVNLMPSRAVLSPRERQLRIWFLIALLVSTAITVLCLGGLMLYRLALGAQIGAEESKKSQTLSRLENQRELAAKLRTLKDKVSGIEMIQKSRIDLPGRIDFIKALIPNGASMMGMELGANNETNFTLSLTGVDSLSSLLPSLTTTSGKEKLSKVRLRGLRLGSDNSVSLTVDAVFKPKNVNENQP